MIKNSHQRNFSYGRDLVNYTSDAKGTYKLKDLSQYQKSVEVRNANAKLTRSTNVAFGSDEPNNNGMSKTQGTGFTPATAAMKITSPPKQNPQP